MKYKKRNIDPELKRKIDLYVNGALDDEHVDRLWAELAHDSKALSYLKSIVSIREIDDEKHKERLKTTTQKHTPVYWSLSAAVVLIIGAFFIFHFVRRPAKSVQPITSIALINNRSAGGTSNGNAILRKAVKFANQGKPDMAVRTIDVKLSRTDDVHTKSLLLMQAGSILYNAARYREALFRFKRVTKTRVTDMLMREKAYWYMGNTYFQLGELKAAKTAFQTAYDLNGAYYRVAKKYLTALGGM